MEPAKSRVQISDERGSLRIVIPAKRNWILIPFLGFWICLWAMGEVMASRAFFKENMPLFADFFLIAWLGMWTVGGGFVIYLWLWNVFGKEVVLVNGQMLSTRREIGKYGKTTEFMLPHVRHLRASNAILNPSDPSSGLQVWGVGGGSIAFDYCDPRTFPKTYRFGTALDEAEAKHIIIAIKNRFNIQDSDSNSAQQLGIGLR